MKITIYELLGLIKEGKAPKKIKLGEYEYVYYERLEGLYNYKCIDTGEYFHDDWFIENILNDEVIVIEEEKEIEKIKELPIKLFHNKQKILANKLNELIDVINDMRDKE